jgi:hypothetical protein
MDACMRGCLPMSVESVDDEDEDEDDVDDDDELTAASTRELSVSRLLAD